MKNKWNIPIISPGNPLLLSIRDTLSATILVFVRFNQANVSAMETNNEERKMLIANYEQLLEKVHHDLKNEMFALSLTIELLKKAPQEAMPRFLRLLDTFANKLQHMKMLIQELMQAQSS